MLPWKPRPVDETVRAFRVPVGEAVMFTRHTEQAPAEAPTVVLVHGLGMSGRSMVPLMRVLAPHVRAWAPDLPGFGSSRGPHHALEIHELADALHAWTTRLGLQPDLYVGHSLGCQVLGHMAVRHPGSVPAAVLVNPTRDPEAETVTANALRLALDLPREPMSLVALAAYDYLRSHPRRMVKTFADAILNPVADRLPTLHVPVMVLRGERDPVVPHRFAAMVAELLPEGSLVEVEGGAHGLPFTHHHEVAAVLLDFLRTCGHLRPEGDVTGR
jgi:2-hydroxy-6-oxonona-2,4-dienedioate hydrolase